MLHRKTRSGLVQGRITKQLGGFVQKYLGIPFAQPPVANLRWRSPLKEKSWDGVRPAMRYQAACMQHQNGLISNYLPSREDCLYLNVFKKTTNMNATNVSVMLFFHGGVIRLGLLVFLVRCRGAFNSDSEDVIIVTSNYRLGVFGYLGSDELRDTSSTGYNSTGNWGLQDQRAAMKWVQDSIANFGGDVNRVTIFGESAGAGSTSVHLLAPR